MPTRPRSSNNSTPIELPEFIDRADERPVVMLNLLDFKPGGGRERSEEYAEAVGPLLEQAGAKVIFAATAAAPLIGPSEWDVVALVEYPTRRVFLEMVSSEKYLEIAHLRTEALDRSELHPLDRLPEGDALAG
ncbi:MAG TPA: DUF1330 domain-containing protein [Solirubrobacterales bacterium]|nr:DUF1330 domain-containing protein [Solirubrobacterales bacterium]